MTWTEVTTSMHICDVLSLIEVDDIMFNARNPSAPETSK